MHLHTWLTSDDPRRRRRLLFPIVFAMSLVMALPVGPAWATTALSHIQGRVTDASGTPIPGAFVVAQRVTPTPAYVRTIETTADGSYSMAVIPGSYHVVASARGYLGQYFDHQTRTKYGTAVIASANRFRRGVAFSLTAEHVVDASSVMTTIAASAATMPTVKRSPRIAGDKSAWAESGGVFLRDLGASADANLTTVAPDPWNMSGSDMNSRYYFYQGYMTDLATGQRTRLTKAPVNGMACDERYVCMSATWSARTVPHTRFGIIVRDLDTGTTTFFDFMSNRVQVNPGSVAEGRAAVSVQTGSGSWVRTLDLARHRVVPGAIGPLSWDVPTAVPWAGKVAFTDEQLGIWMAAPDGSGVVKIVHSDAMTGMVGDGHRLLWEDYSGDATLIKTYDLATSVESTVAVLAEDNMWSSNPEYDVSGDTFVWTEGLVGNGMTGPDEGGVVVRSATASDIAHPQRIDSPRFAKDEPTLPILVDGYIAWANNSGYPEGSGQDDLYARPLSGGPASVIAADVRFDDQWAPSALSGSRVAWAKLGTDSYGWSDDSVTVFVTDLATAETTRVVTDLPKYSYGWGGLGWNVDDADLVGSGDWVYVHTEQPSPYSGYLDESPFEIMAVNAVTGEKRVLATAATDWHARLVSAGGGRLLWSDAKGTVRLYDPATRVSPATSASLGLKGRAFAADYPLVTGLTSSFSYGFAWGSPLTAGSLATASSTVVDPFLWYPVAYQPLAASGGRMLVGDRVYDTASATWSDLHVASDHFPTAGPATSSVVLDGGALRGPTVAVSRRDQRFSPTIGYSSESAILTGDLGDLEATSSRK
jgi:hypothetical protein